MENPSAKAIVQRLTTVIVGLVVENVANAIKVQSELQGTVGRHKEIVWEFRDLLENNIRINRSPSFYAGRLNITVAYLNEAVNAVLRTSVGRHIQDEIIVEGAAWATILSRVITTAIYIRFLTKAEVKVSVALFAPTIRMYLDIIKIGISMLFLQLLQTLSISLLQKAAVKYGAEAVAAVGIVLKIVTLGTNVVFGFVKGLQPMAGYNYGAGNFQRLKEAVRCSLILTTSFCVLWSTFILVFASPIISCFGKDETMQGIARIALRANTIMFFTFGFQFVYSTLYMAIGRARQSLSLLLNIGRQGLFFIPAILLLPSYWGLNGVLYAQPVADVFATLMTLLFAVRIHREIGHQSHLTTENL